MAKAPMCAMCGTAHWSTQPCPGFKGAGRLSIDVLPSVVREARVAPAALTVRSVVEVGYAERLAELEKRVDVMEEEIRAGRTPRVKGEEAKKKAAAERQRAYRERKAKERVEESERV